MSQFEGETYKLNEHTSTTESHVPIHGHKKKCREMKS